MVLVTTKTGVSCNESRNPSYMEKSSGFCNISGDIFLFTSKADVGMANNDIINRSSLINTWSMVVMVYS